MVTHETVGERFAEAGLAAGRFVSVKDGQKMCVDHDTRYDDPSAVPGRNYGIYADEDDDLVVLDVDDHEDESLDNESRVAVAALSGLPGTLEFKSPHVPEADAGGHRIYKLAGDKTPAELFKERFGKMNPVPSWGEVIAKNKYVVAPGSELDECDKDWHDCSEEGEGRYEIKHDSEIAEVDPEELVSALATDPDLEDIEATDSDEDHATNQDSTSNSQLSNTVSREYSREEIEEMLSHLPGDQHFDDWIRTGYAVYDWNDGETGKEVFEEWSRNNRKWEEEESQRQIDYIWTNGEQAGDDPDDRNASVGTLVYLAKENDWVPPYTSEEEDTEAGIGPKNPAGELTEDGGCYGYYDEIASGDGQEVIWKQVTNFTLETLEFVEVDDGEVIRIRVTPAHDAEDSYEVTVAPTTFNDFASFKEDVVVGRTTQFSAEHGNETLNDLRMTVGAQNAPERKGVSHVGAASERLNEWVTPNGVLMANGWKDDPEHRYYAKASSESDDESIVGDKWQLTPDDGAGYDTAEVKKALRHLPRARLPGRALAVLGWFYAAPAKPLVHAEEGEFNHLHVRGKTESGKTSFLQVLNEAFGMNGSPWSASSTPFSLEQLHVGSRGVPVWLDEYKPSDMGSDKVDKLHRLLRMATREAVWTKGRPNQTFMKFKLQSPVVISGEQQVAEPAVRRRMLQVNLTERATNQPEHVKAYSELAGEPYEDENGVDRIPGGVNLQDHARAYYRFLLSQDSESLRDVWASARETCVRLMNDVGMSLEDSESQAAQTVVFGYRLYRKLAKEMGLDDDELPTEDDLRKAVEHLSSNVGANGQRREHGDEFLELLSGAANAGYVYGPAEAADENEAAGYRVYDPMATPDEAIAIHLPTAYASVKKYAREYNIEDDYNLLSKSDYDDEFGDLAESDDTHVASASHPVKINDSTKRCVLLDPYKTNKRLGTDFDLSPFGLQNVENVEADTSSEEEDGDSDDTAYQATQLQSVAESNSGYATVTVEIKSVDVYDGENSPAKAVLMDCSGPLDAVTWDSRMTTSLEDHNGETVAIKHAKVTEHEGTTQIELREFSDITQIQPGVGHTVGPTPGEKQGQLADAATDGGDELTDKSRVRQYLANCERNETVTAAQIAGECDVSPDTAKSALKTASAQGEVQKDGDGWLVT